LIYNLEELEKKCKKYRRKKFVKNFLLLSAFGVGLFLFYAFYLSPKPPSTISIVEDKNTTIRESDVDVEKVEKPKKIVTIKKEAVKKRPKAEPKPTVSKSDGCFAIQVLYSYDKYLNSVNKELDRLNSRGLECYIKRSEQGGGRVYLRCNAAQSKRELAPFLSYLKRSFNGDYFIVNESCKYAKRYDKVPTVPKNATKNAKLYTEKRDEPPKKKSIPVLVSHKAGIDKLFKVFNDRPNYEIAYKIALRYYNGKDYANALVWAKRANKLDSQREGAWILYAKSLYSLGKPEKARELLRLYLNFQNSGEAQKLLAQWRDTNND